MFNLQKFIYVFLLMFNFLEFISECLMMPNLKEFIWDENLVPGEYYQGENPLALPKLNLQFLTLHDYLLRNFKLFQLESTYEIRSAPIKFFKFKCSAY